MQKGYFLKKNLSNLELWSLLTTYRKSYMGFSLRIICDQVLTVNIVYRLCTLDAMRRYVVTNFCRRADVLKVNLLESRGNYSATSNNMKLVHWPLMGGLFMVQR